MASPPIAMPDPRKLLVVEDDDEMRQLLSDYLTSSGFAVATASDMPSALQEARDHAYELIVSNLSLRGASALEMVSKLKSSPGLKPDFILITGFADWAAYSEAVSLGVSEYMSKPFRMEELVRKIRDTLRRRSQLGAPPQGL